jgi:TRAP-type uncharacterized transport system substrate-binding protein
MVFLPLEDEVLKKMESYGYRRSVIPRSVFKGLDQDVPALDFSGWPLCCRRELPDEIAYGVVQAIDQRKKTMPVDAEALDLTRICRDTEEGPLCVPLHPGAEKYYKEQGYL